MRKTTIEELRAMELHDSRWLVKGFLEVFRVPGGWVYCWHWETEQNPSQVFVPEPTPRDKLNKGGLKNYNQRAVEKFYDIMCLAKNIHKLLESNDESVYIGLKKASPKEAATIFLGYREFFDIARFLAGPKNAIKKKDVKLNNTDPLFYVVSLSYSGIKLKTEIERTNPAHQKFLEAYKEFMEEEP